VLSSLTATVKYAHSENSADTLTRATLLRRAHGAVLRRHREAAARSLADVAAAAQCSPAHLSEVERGRKDVSAQRLAAIAAALELPLHALYADIADELAPSAMVDARARPADPRVQLELAAAALGKDALRAVADFGTYLANTSAAPPRRRIGFALPHRTPS
jgi:transcriptional regulator with XRE-family HTH domain